MVTDSYSKMMSDIAMRSMHGSGSDYGDEIGLLLRQQRMQQQQGNDMESELSLYRSGSAPPTVEGSLSAVGGLFSTEGTSIPEEELRSDPNYVSYYYSNVNRNPRLPPPLLSKEDWRFAQRSSVLGGIGDRRKANKALGVSNGDNGSEKRKEWSGDGLIGLPGLGLGSRQMSIAEIIQDDINHVAPISKHPSRPASRNAFDDSVESSEFGHIHHDLVTIDALHSSANIHSIVGTASHSYASALGASLSRSATPDPQHVARAPSPRIPPIGNGRVNSLDKRNVNGPNSFNNVSPNITEPSDLTAALSAMNLTASRRVDQDNHLRSQVQHKHSDNEKLFHIKQNSSSNLSDSGKLYFNSIAEANEASYMSMARGVGMNVNNNTSLATDGEAEPPKPIAPPTSSYVKGSPIPTLISGGSPPSHYKNLDSPNSSLSNYGLNGYVINPTSPSMVENQLSSGNLPPLFENTACALGVAGIDSRALGGDLSLGSNLMSAATELHNLKRVGNHNVGSALQMSHMDPFYHQYLRASGYGSVQVAALNDLAIDRESHSGSYMDLQGLQKAYLGSLLSPQKSQYGLPYLEKNSSLNHGYYGNPGFNLDGSFSGISLGGGPLFSNSPISLGVSPRHGDRSMRFPSGVRNLSGGIMGWQSEACRSLNGNFGSSLLDEFKSNKARCFELSEIAGHVVEFSADQYGSRFIQQKLETASAEEKNMVFHEIMPQALSLMTDVFGNYVIQKFFEHGIASQIRELADQLTGNVLTLSLQMYGCRVIQKAMEVVDLDQKTSMVAELDGQVMCCVRDQNGNHVIQKCIECIPEDAIQFIISTFYDQVVTLSTHPYGCRVIQRVLEHCSDPNTQRIVMDEILQFVYMLAQDQYGNYVVQHVLEHGKPDERSAIISKLIGQIVQMSLQKFASNVVEKCLTYGTPEERQMLVNEMLGSTDENEPLQVMMKDQFANYVVQKVLETCDDQQLELILNRIKVHLNALKKYTYGKHIVARVEKLVAAGERRIGSLSTYTA